MFDMKCDSRNIYPLVDTIPPPQRCPKFITSDDYVR
jgi:hypothetical protein